MAEPAAADIFRPAALEALGAFPIDPDALELMSLSENVTYRVVDRRDGAAYALRLHRPWYHTLDELISERDWIRALDGAGIAVQAPMRTRDGREYAAVTIPATGERRFAGLARWTTGRVLAEVLRETDDAGLAAPFRAARRPHGLAARPRRGLAATGEIHAARAGCRWADGQRAALGTVLGSRGPVRRGTAADATTCGRACRRRSRGWTGGPPSTA